MSDARLRDLERRWKETGTIEDEAAYLRERVRVGDLSRENLELAAYCGHEGASSAVGSPGQVRQEDDAWWQALARWGRAPAAAGLLAIAESELERFGGEGDRDEAFSRGLSAVLRAGRAWLTCPCASHASEVAGLGTEPKSRLKSAYWDEERRDGQPLGEAKLSALASAVGVTLAIESRHDADAAEHLLENLTSETRPLGLRAVISWALAARGSSP